MQQYYVVSNNHEFTADQGTYYRPDGSLELNVKKAAVFSDYETAEAIASGYEFGEVIEVTNVIEMMENAP